MSLFRPEAVAAAAPTHFGEVLLAQPARLKWLSISAITSALAALPLLIFGEFSRSETVYGYITPTDGVSQVFPTQAGTISAVHVREGEVVQRGEVLFEISTELANGADNGALSAQLEVLEQRIQERRLQGQLSVQRLQSEIERTKHRLDAVRADIAHLREQKSIADARLQISQSQWARWQEARNRGILSDAEIEQREQDLLDAQMASSKFEREIASRRDEFNDLRQSIATKSIDVTLAESQARSEVALLNQSKSELVGAIAREVTAAIDRQVTAIQATVGQAAKPNAPMALILPQNEDLHAQVYAPTRTAGFIELNQSVLLRVDAFPYQRFGTIEGRVKQVSGTALSPSEVISSIPITEAVYRLTVDLDQQSIEAYGASEALQSGMAVQADLVIDRRPLWRWLLDPLLAHKG